MAGSMGKDGWSQAVTEISTSRSSTKVTVLGPSQFQRKVYSKVEASTRCMLLSGLTRSMGLLALKVAMTLPSITQGSGWSGGLPLGIWRWE